MSKFPCYDEAFILREIYALAKKVDAAIFSLRKSTDKTVHDEASDLAKRTVYVPYVFSRAVLGAFAAVFGRHPARVLGALKTLIFGNLRNIEFLLKNLAFFPKAVYLADLVERQGIDHIHAYWATYPASVALAVSQITGKPFSFTGHAHDIYLNTTHLGAKIMKAKFVATCTQKNKDYLKLISPEYPAERILVIHHGIELQKFYFESKNGDTAQILSVGTLQRHKGFEYFIEALGKLKERGVSFHATIVGGGPLEEKLRERIQLLGLQESVTLTGPLKQDAVIPYYRYAHIKVLMAQPEWHWGIPNVFIEALAAKAAVVTTKFGSVEELVKDGISGVIVPPKDSGALAAVLENLITNSELRDRLAEAGYETVVRQFDLEKNVGKYVQCFEREGESSNRKQVTSNAKQVTNNESRPLPLRSRRICHLIWALEPGGAERQVVTIAKWQKTHGYEPVVVCLTRKGSLAGELEASGIPVFLVQKQPGADFSVVGKLSRFLRDHAVEILHTHIPTASLWGRLAAMKAGTSRVVVSEHSDMAYQDIRFRIINYLLSGATDRFLVVSKHIGDLLVGSGVPGKKITVVHNGISLNSRASEASSRKDVCQELGVSADAPIVGTVGRMEPRKDHATFIRACREIRKSHPGTNFLLAGDGPCRRAMENLARELGLNGNFHFLGTRSDVDRLLDAIDVFVLSSTTEGISNSLLEAMAHEKPCVVTRVGGNPEVIADEKNGRLVPAASPSNLADAVTEILADREKADRLGREARQTAEKKFSVEVMMKGLDEVYEEITQQST
ncbi:MAG: glycosyltransferase [Candidatus Omnitrophica bacterium]|nr:glycosyltransferase [Candidatus Omnitrophota bacterium]